MKQFFTSLLVLLAPTQLLASTVYEMELPSLTSTGSVQLEEYKGKYLLVSMFEPNCSWCYRQMKAFNRVVEHCSKLQPLSIGVNGSKQALRSELRKAKVHYPALMTTPEWRSQIGKTEATPWTLLFDTQGNLVANLRGYIPFKKWRALFPDQCS